MRTTYVAICLILLVSPQGPSAVTRSTSDLPKRLLQAGDLRHEGSFTLPDTHDTEGRPCFEWAQGVIAFNPVGPSLFVVGHDHGQQVGEVEIPAFGEQAPVLQECVDALDGRISEINPQDPNSKKIGGMIVIGERLVLAAYSYYDGGGTAVASHFVRPTDLGSGDVLGPVRVGDIAVGLTAGYFGVVPMEWQEALGGSLLNGQCCLSIINRTSHGPAASSLSAEAMLEANDPVPATPLVFYPESRRWLGNWDSTGPWFNGTTRVRGIALPEGTNSVLFFGRHGLGTFCYGTGEACDDPECPGESTHAYPYRAQVWAYRASDLASIRDGDPPWDVEPYATWELEGLTTTNVSGVTVDPATGHIYVAENFGDGLKPRIHVFSVVPK